MQYLKQKGKTTQLNFISRPTVINAVHFYNKFSYNFSLLRNLSVR